MGKSHRDNTAARKKRGPGAFAKKAKRRTAVPTCRVCGTVCRAKVLSGDAVCPRCLERVCHV